MKAFISYKNEERQTAAHVQEALATIGVECFMAHEHIEVSEEWRRRIMQELRVADIFVGLVSAAFRASDWCSQEAGIAAAREPRIHRPVSDAPSQGLL